MIVFIYRNSKSLRVNSLRCSQVALSLRQLFIIFLSYRIIGILTLACGQMRYGKMVLFLLKSSTYRLPTAKENFIALVLGRDSNSMLIVVHWSSARGQLFVSGNQISYKVKKENINYWTCQNHWGGLYWLSR